MSAVWAVTFPFFALVLCGYMAVRLRWLPGEAVWGLNTFVLYFALPCMLFDFGRATPLGQLLSPGVAVVWLTAAAVLVGWSVALARRRGMGWPDAAMGALVTAFPNSGFMGVPLIVALLGEVAAGPVMATLLLDLVVVTSVCIGLAHMGPGAGRADAPTAAQAMRRAWRGMLRNPMPWAIGLGAAAGALDVALWPALARTVQLLGQAASPVALFTIGAVLARSQARVQMQAGAERADAGRQDAAAVALKLLLHPALVLGLGWAAVRMGVLAHGAWLALTLVAALPAASNVSLLADRFGADGTRVARIIMWTTALSFVSFSAVVRWLR